VRAIAALLLLSAVSWSVAARQSESGSSPSLLLSAKLLRRLQRDRERETVRWQNFDRRVRTVLDSPERGFDLALYYVASHDESRAREAVAWAVAHPCETRQITLIEDWLGDAFPENSKRQVHASNCSSAASAANSSPTQVARNTLFRAIVSGQVDEAAFDPANKRVVAELKGPRALDPSTLYAAIEYIMVYRAYKRVDLRESDASFFSAFPKSLLLGLKPADVEQPAAMIHISALALVTLDPNLESSQFLQGWALEDRQMLRDGPGVAYEYLWADPYLPGIAYQNMDPWLYDMNGHLLARTDWQPDSCWISLSAGQTTVQNCGRAPLTQEMKFGSLTLRPLSSGCSVVAPRSPKETLIFRMPAGIPLNYERQGDKTTRQVPDSAGLWSVPVDTSGKVCLASSGKR